MWMKQHGDRDLIADLSVSRGWEDTSVIVVDFNKGKGLENLCMRAISNLFIVKAREKEESVQISVTKAEQDAMDDFFDSIY